MMPSDILLYSRLMLRPSERRYPATDGGVDVDTRTQTLSGCRESIRRGEERL